MQSEAGRLAKCAKVKSETLKADDTKTPTDFFPRYKTAIIIPVKLSATVQTVSCMSSENPIAIANIVTAINGKSKANRKIFISDHNAEKISYQLNFLEITKKQKHLK